LGLPEWLFDRAIIEYLPAAILLLSASMILVGLYKIYQEV